jgi:hypothetical protein
VSIRRPSSNFAVLSGLAFGVASVGGHWLLAAAPLLLAPLLAFRYPARVRGVLAGSALFGLALVLIVRGVEAVARR